ncbi:TRAP transporter small permease [Thermovirga sp.]|uniref:TRAP transporter small permease n=1 Tax=Thermovirga sp. TaxID=2699834 RepID=UPI0025FD8535|nr:TRAP transporter small permease [Thermovirga sp.]MBO8154508.1 TRAP transporter small permease [Thermovirga sp.]
MALLEKINSLFDKLLKQVVIIVMGAMLAVIFVQVIARYVFHNSLSFSEELARYLFVWCVFLCLPVVHRRGGHMVVGVLSERLEGFPLKALRLVAQFLTLVFMIIIFKNGITMIQRTYFQTSPALQIKMSYVYYALPIGSAAMILNTIEEMLKTLKKPSSETKPQLHLD